MSDSATPWTTACQACLSITNSRSLLKLMSIELVMPSNHLVLSHPLLLQPSIFPSIRVFSKELVLCIRWPKYWSFSFSISPYNEYSGLILFRIDWFEVQGTLESSSTPQFKSINFLASAFFIVQFSHPYLLNTVAFGSYYFLLEYNCFTSLCRFLMYDNESALCIHTSPPS